MEATIGLAGPVDRGDVVALLAAQMAEHEIPLASAALDNAVDGALVSDEPGCFLLARMGDTAVGVAYLSFVWAIEHGGRSAWLEELYVVPHHRERGIGAQLLQAALDHAKALGCAAVDLEVETSHGRAAHLYERAGFRAHTRARWVRSLR